MVIKKIPELEKIDEIEMMCARDRPIYEQINSFSIALYVLGYDEGPDLMSVKELDKSEASEILKENFEEIEKSDIPLGYSISESKERYLLVIGDLVYPKHFAVIVDTKNKRPFFSKLRCIGSGFDSIEELMSVFLGEDEIDYDDIHYFKKI